MVRGPFNGVPASLAPEGVGACSPVPPKVSMMPLSRSTAADAVIADVGDIEGTVAVKLDAVRTAELCLGSGAAITGEAFLACPRPPSR